MNVVEINQTKFTEKEIRFLLDYIESVYQLLEKYGVCLDSKNRTMFYKSSLKFFIDFKKDDFPFEEIDELDYEIEKSNKLEQMETEINEMIRKE